jgi:hypothetical protein
MDPNSLEANVRNTMSAVTTLAKRRTGAKQRDAVIAHYGQNCWWCGCETVISIEVAHGLTSTATIEHCEDDSEDILPALYRAFDHVGWIGMDDDGEYRLI